MKLTSSREQLPVFVDVLMALALVVSLVCLLYASSVPGGATSMLIIVVLWILPLFGLTYLAVVGVSIASRKLFRSLWWPPVFIMVSIAILALDVSERIHWPFIKSDLEQAVASGQCPSSAGLTRDITCTEVSGNPAFDLGGGFIDSYYLVRAPGGLDLAKPMEIQRDLGDSWYLVYVPFE
ncbi:hypothetical protein CKALI_06990 [Corynebacterium kalinowskii]|uniref:Uncharacterized protein n=1 Tax=Corynebacterium kalinowskii TaxID=2675216 RepID=A0A6B8VY65_9CORY|nr:hypothetical protein [Corynebacterium kalinowskii]QGU02260.1 hypothetical protein CKALI_06990 [Corynebacterium kalinowskii]